MIRPSSITLFAAIALFVSVSAADDVLVGTKDNFESIISSDELTLVKFYAPWCGHCKKMAPDFKEAATELKGKAQLVDLDATVEKDLAQKYEIRGFPTLKLFSKGELLSDYKGGRTKEDLVKYIERALLPYATECADADALAKFVADNKGKSVFVAAKLDKLKSAYKKTSMSIRDMSPDTVAFATVEDPALLKELAGKDVEADSVLLVHDDESTDVYSDDADSFEQWASVGSLPLFGELSRDTAGLYTELDKPVFLLFQDPEKINKDMNADIADIAKSHRSSGSYNFV